MVTEQEAPEAVTEAPPASGEFETEEEPIVSEEAKAPPEAEPTAEAEAPESGTPEATSEAQAPPATEEPAAPSHEAEYLAELKVLRTRGEEQRRQIREGEAARQRELSAQAIEERVEAHRRDTRVRLENWNVDPVEAETRVEQEAGQERQRLQNEVHQRQAAVSFVEARHGNARTQMETWVSRLVQENGLTAQTHEALRNMIPTDLLGQETLMNPDAQFGGDQRFVEIGQSLGQFAKDLGGATRVTSEATAARRAAVKPQQLETPTGTGTMSDEQKVAGYGAGTYDNHAEAQAAMRRQGLLD